MAGSSHSVVLLLLAGNATKNNEFACVMDTDTIARALDISVNEARQLAVSHVSGADYHNLEGQYSLITQEGIQGLDQMSFTANSGRLNLQQHQL